MEPAQVPAKPASVPAEGTPPLPIQTVAGLAAATGFDETDIFRLSDDELHTMLENEFPDLKLKIIGKKKIAQEVVAHRCNS